MRTVRFAMLSPSISASTRADHRLSSALFRDRELEGIEFERPTQRVGPRSDVDPKGLAALRVLLDLDADNRRAGRIRLRPDDAFRLTLLQSGFEDLADVGERQGRD